MFGRQREAWILIGLALVGVVVLLLNLRSPAPPVASASQAGGKTAVEACSLPTSDPKAGANLDWHLVLRMDSTQETTMLFVSGWSRAVCTAYRAESGGFFSSVIGVGGDPSPQPDDDALTYETGSGGGTGTYPTDLIVGHVPRATAWVEAVTSDGERRQATLGNGWYMVRADVGAGVSVVEVSAYDSTGKLIARLKGSGVPKAGDRATPLPIPAQ